MSAQAIDEWEAGLAEVEGLLDLDIGDTDTDAAWDGSTAADEVDAILAKWERQTTMREAEAGRIEDEAERNRTLSTLAAGDIYAASVAVDLARRAEDGDGEAAGARPRPPDPEVPAELAAQLREFERSPFVPTDAGWRERLQHSLDRVVDDASERILEVGLTSATPTVAMKVTDALAAIAGGVLGQLVDTAKEALSWLKRKALEALGWAASKLSKLFGSRVEQAVAEWVDGELDELPSTLVARAAGVEATVDAWKRAADGGTDVDALVVSIEPMEAGKVDALKWAGRGVSVYGYLASALLMVGGIVAAAAIAIGLVGWMLWAAIDHSHDVRGLVG